MSDARILGVVCGKPVEATGNPCMRISGHLGACIDSTGVMGYTPPTIDLPWPRPKIPDKVILLLAYTVLCYGAQIFVDVYLLVR